MKIYTAEELKSMDIEDIEKYFAKMHKANSE